MIRETTEEQRKKSGKDNNDGGQHYKCRLGLYATTMPRTSNEHFTNIPRHFLLMMVSAKDGWHFLT